MTTLTHTFRPFLAPRCARLAASAITEAQERHAVYGVAACLLAGGVYLVLHALSLVTAFS
jgi:hypothetical protein